jgi:3-oxoacyl-[acyl-carrier-protein] synthase II
MAERVVVTGLGVVTPIGVGLPAFTDSLRRGRSGVRRITAFDCSGFDTQIAASVPEAEFDPLAFVHPAKAVKLMNRASQFAVVAAGMARAHARLGPDAIDPFRLGVSLGAGGMGLLDGDLLESQARAVIGGLEAADRPVFDVPAFAHSFRARTNPIAVLRALPTLAAAHMAIQHTARGPNGTVATACTAGTQAIGDALRLLRNGEADAMLAGGADAPINPMGVLGFGMLGTLSRRNEDPARASRPFERSRDGFVLGEGAAIAVLERESFARARGAPVLAEIAGYAASCDAYRITDERPDAAGAAAAVRGCLRDAGIDAAAVEYVNAHGTATPMNDRIETAVLKEVFREHAGRVPVSSTKSTLGHLLAAAGAVELAACVVCMNAGFLPPTINLDAPDPECDLDYVPHRAREARFDTALSNSFGFGGQNACLLIRRYPGS